MRSPGSILARRALLVVATSPLVVGLFHRLESPGSRSESIPFETASSDDALRHSAGSDKLVMIDFHADGTDDEPS